MTKNEIEKLRLAVDERRMQPALAMLKKWKEHIGSRNSSDPSASLLLFCGARLLDDDRGHLDLIQRLLDRCLRDRMNLVWNREDCIRLDLSEGIVKLHTGDLKNAIDLFDLAARNARRVDVIELQAEANYYLPRALYKNGQLGKAEQILSKVRRQKLPRAVLGKISLLHAWVLFLQNRLIESVLGIPCQKQVKQTLLLTEIECQSDQQVEAYVFDDRQFLVVADRGAIVGVPEGIWEITLLQGVNESTIARLAFQLENDGVMAEGA